MLIKQFCNCFFCFEVVYKTFKGDCIPFVITKKRKPTLGSNYYNHVRCVGSEKSGSFQSQHFLHGCTRKFTSNNYFLLSTPCKASNITNLALFTDDYGSF